MSSKVLLGYATFPGEETAQQICDVLVREGSIACANLLGPARSIYKWNGQVHNETEWIAVLKTSELKKTILMERFRALHPYANPCLVFLNIEDGLPAFLQWAYVQCI